MLASSSSSFLCFCRNLNTMSRGCCFARHGSKLAPQRHTRNSKLLLCWSGAGGPPIQGSNTKSCISKNSIVSPRLAPLYLVHV